MTLDALIAAAETELRLRVQIMSVEPAVVIALCRVAKAAREHSHELHVVAALQALDAALEEGA